MKRLDKLMLGVFAVLLVSLPARANESAVDEDLRLGGGVLLGYAGGAGVQFSAIASGIAADFPMSVRLGTGYARVAPGRQRAHRAGDRSGESLR